MSIDYEKLIASIDCEKLIASIYCEKGNRNIVPVLALIVRSQK